MPKLTKAEQAKFDFLFLDELFNAKIDITAFELKTVEGPPNDEFYGVEIRRELHFKDGEILGFSKYVTYYETKEPHFWEYVAESCAHMVINKLNPNMALGAQKLHKYYKKMMDAEFNA